MNIGLASSLHVYHIAKQMGWSECRKWLHLVFAKQNAAWLAWSKWKNNFWLTNSICLAHLAFYIKKLGKNNLASLNNFRWLLWSTLYNVRYLYRAALFIAFFRSRSWFSSLIKFYIYENRIERKRPYIKCYIWLDKTKNSIKMNISFSNEI